MKKLFITFLSLILVLTACNGNSGGTKTSKSDEALFYKYITAEFTMDAPVDWETINAFPTQYPDEIRVAFRNNVKDSDFVANISVIRENNSTTMTNSDLSQTKLSDHKDTLISYKLISQEVVTLSVSGSDSNTTINTFQGKNEASGPTFEFKQVYLTKGETAWTATATYSPNEDAFVIETMETMLKSFTLK